MERGWMIRISRCWDVEKKNIAEKGCLTMPVFMIVCVKFRKVKDAQPVSCYYIDLKKLIRLLSLVKSFCTT